MITVENRKQYTYNCMENWKYLVSVLSVPSKKINVSKKYPLIPFPYLVTWHWGLVLSYFLLESQLDSNINNEA